MDKKTVRDLDVAGKKVLVRVDFNVPLTIKVIFLMTLVSVLLWKPLNIWWNKKLLLS